MRVISASVVLAWLCAPLPAVAQQPPAGVPGQQATPPARPEQPPPATASRAFTAPIGMIFNTVRPERVNDFEKFVGALRQALDASTNATVRAQAQGWRIMKAAEPGPNGSVVYVFLLDPAIPGADYGLGRILAEAFPDPAMLQDMWKLYTDSVTSGGSLLNLMLVEGKPPLGDPADAPRMLPPK